MTLVCDRGPFLSCTELLTLSAGDYVVNVAPNAGGRIARFWSRNSRQDLLVPLGRAGFHAHQWLKAGAFPMLPFTNRFPAHGLRFGGHSANPENGVDGFALHGFGHRIPWTVTAKTPESVVMRVECPADPIQWPWNWSACQRMELSPTGLRLTLELFNTGTEDMPASLGWHPYFLVDEEDADLRIGASHRFELDQSGTVVDPCAAIVSATVHRGQTVAFSGWNGRATLSQVAVECEGTTNLVVHRPANGRYLCLEPVTVLPGLLGANDPLRAGGIMRLSIGCKIIETG
ncbi:MAG: hypothetical protein LCH61_08180 [Proteobacteria bacterium]|nr:hypothetical protein [Pseudomonadota bacterium]